MGLMQLNSRYHDYFVENFYSGEEPFDPFDPSHNVEIGVRYLRYLYDTIGDWYLAVLSYNAGIGNVYRNTIPKSSLAYVKRVMA